MFEEGSEVLYARPPPGYRKYVNGVALIWRLNTPLSGEADADRIWYKTFMKFLIEERGFTQSEYDPCMLWKTLANGERLVCVVYVDDGFSSDDGSAEADEELAIIDRRFKIIIKDAAFFLGNNIICHSRSRVTLSSRAYVDRIVERYLTGAGVRGSAATPCEKTIVAKYEEALASRRGAPGPKPGPEDLRTTYPSKVGALIYSHLLCAREPR